MPSEQWVSEKASQLLRYGHTTHDAITAFAQDVISRTRAEERALSEMTVTLCGSTRFKAAYIDWFQRLTDKGFIVLTVGRYLPKTDHGSALKADLDKLHFRKIDRSSRILVLDVGGYIGDSTRNEIAHAERTGKQVDYLSKLYPDYVEPPLAETDIGRAVAEEERAHATQALKLERERCMKAALSVRYGPPSMWVGFAPEGWHLADKCTPRDASMHDNGCVDAAQAIRARTLTDAL